MTAACSDADMAALGGAGADCSEGLRSSRGRGAGAGGRGRGGGAAEEAGTCACACGACAGACACCCAAADVPGLYVTVGRRPALEDESDGESAAPGLLAVAARDAAATLLPTDCTDDEALA